MSKSSVAAQDLTEAFFSCLPKGKKQQYSEAQWGATLQQFYKEAGKIRARYRLGVLGRALTAYHFQKRLFEAGIDSDVVRKVVFSLLLNAFHPGA